VTVVALVTTAVEGADAGRVQTITAAVGWVAALLAALGGLWQVRIAKRANVSGDVKEARAQEAANRRDAVAEWQTIAATYKAERDALAARLQTAEATIAALHRQGEDDRTIRMVHMAWDWEALEEASRVGLRLRPAPPLLPPRDGDG
jgi:hypothetical protein